MEGRVTSNRKVREEIFTRNKSGRGLPQSKTLREGDGGGEFRQILDCGSPLPLWRRHRKDDTRTINWPRCNSSTSAIGNRQLTFPSLKPPALRFLPSES